MQTLPTPPPPAAAPAAADALVDIATVMATTGRALPISTVLPRPEAAEGLVAEPADPSRLLPTVVPHTRPARATTVAGQATAGLGRRSVTGRARLPTADCWWPLHHLVPEEGPAR
ncbi:hypothetical protein [Streptomyces radiopugnans]|uniref:hypothetical protein n=1 Tax=Streptomyces radiopugnans TaxID=403935 RepID=UPI003F19F27A